MKNPDTLLVGFDNAHGDDAAVLIVGRKAPGGLGSDYQPVSRERSIRAVSAIASKQ